MLNETQLMMINHLPQKKLKKKNYTPKNQIKKEMHPPPLPLPTSQKINSITADENDWICGDCGEGCDNDGDCCWTTCDICLSNYHLECSGIQYPMEHYWDIDHDSREFECPDCAVYFIGQISYWKIVIAKPAFFPNICLSSLFMFFPGWVVFYMAFCMLKFCFSQILKNLRIVT